jgi:uncharacterized DUF497 family protein
MNEDMLEFEWDAEKARANLARHGISFDVAKLVFLDPYHISERDQRFDYGEERWQTTGAVENTYLMLFVVHTNRGGDAETIRIISARRANPRERRRYGNRKGL